MSATPVRNARADAEPTVGAAVAALAPSSPAPGGTTTAAACTPVRVGGSLLDDDEADAAAADDTSLLVPWQPWPLHYVRSALHTGTLTKRELLLHIKNAPAGTVSAEWASARRLDSRTRQLAASHTISSAFSLYEEFVEQIVSRSGQSTGTDGADGAAKYAATLIQTAYRGFSVRSTLKYVSGPVVVIWVNTCVACAHRTVCARDRRQNSGEVRGSAGSPRVLNLHATPRGQVLRGVNGGKEYYFRKFAWALFQFILAGAAGGCVGAHRVCPGCDLPCLT